MTRQLLIYDDPVPLSSDSHRDLSVRHVTGVPQAAGLNSVPIVLGEFEKVAAEYPIVFAGTGEATMPVALLGLGADENLFLDEQGNWTGRYLPAFLRRYPFVFASGGDDRLTLCLDMKYPGVNREGRGERLFDADGNRTQYLENSLRFVSDYQAQHTATQRFCARLEGLGLFEDARAEATLPDGSRRQLTGFRSVSAPRLAALDDAAALALFRDDGLRMVHLQLASLEQMSALAAVAAKPVAPGGALAAGPNSAESEEKGAGAIPQDA